MDNIALFGAGLCTGIVMLFLIAMFQDSFDSWNYRRKEKKKHESRPEYPYATYFNKYISQIIVQWSEEAGQWRAAYVDHYGNPVVIDEQTRWIHGYGDHPMDAIQNLIGETMVDIVEEVKEARRAKVSGGEGSSTLGEEEQA